MLPRGRPCCVYLIKRLRRGAHLAISCAHPQRPARGEAFARHAWKNTSINNRRLFYSRLPLPEGPQKEVTHLRILSAATLAAEAVVPSRPRSSAPADPGKPTVGPCTCSLRRSGVPSAHCRQAPSVGACGFSCGFVFFISPRSDLGRSRLALLHAAWFPAESTSLLSAHPPCPP